MMKNAFQSFVSEEAGQTATEYMLVLSVIVIAIVSAAFQFVPAFHAGVADLGADVKKSLMTNQIGQ